MRKVALFVLGLVLSAPAGAWAHCHDTGYVAYASPCLAPLREFVGLWNGANRAPDPEALSAKWVEKGSLVDLDGNKAEGRDKLKILFSSPRYKDLFKNDYLVDTASVIVRTVGDKEKAIFADWDATIGVDLPHHVSAYLEDQSVAGAKTKPDFRFVAVTMTPLDKKP